MPDQFTEHLGWPYPDPDDPLGGINNTVEDLATAAEADVVSIMRPLHSVLLDTAAETIRLEVPPGFAGLSTYRVRGWFRCDESSTVATTLRVRFNDHNALNAYRYSRIQQGETSVTGTVGQQDDFFALGVALAAADAIGDEMSSLELTVFNTPRPRVHWHISFTNAAGPVHRNIVGNGRVLNAAGPLESLEFFFNTGIEFVPGSYAELWRTT